ncbi:hypothetical protein MMC13_002587 [Lambiella insularis]|nr:hypothetical protein [Lambiella insularis]
MAGVSPAKSTCKLARQQGRSTSSHRTTVWGGDEFNCKTFREGMPRDEAATNIERADDHHGLFKSAIHVADALLVGSQIRSAIFSSPSQIDKNVASPGAAILVWVIGGLIAWTAAASFAELGAAIPKNGGMQEYLYYIYGDFLASVMSWTWIMAVKPSSMAVLSIIFAEYWTKVIFNAHTFWVDKGVAIFTLGCVLLLNSISGKTSTRLTDVLMFLKLSTIALVVVIAIVLATGLGSSGQTALPGWRAKNWFANREGDVNGSSSAWQLMGHYTEALYAGLWAYSGWDMANVVAVERRSASRDLPKVIHSALPTVLICFVVTNVSYYVILPWKDIVDSNAIAVAVGRKALGHVGGVIFAFLVSASCLESLNINIFTTGELTVESARHGYLPKALISPERQVSNQDIASYPATTCLKMLSSIKTWALNFVGEREETNTPIKAMVFNSSIACLYILAGTFEGLLTFIGLTDQPLSVLISRQFGYL